MTRAPLILLVLLLLGALWILLGFPEPARPGTGDASRETAPPVVAEQVPAAVDRPPHHARNPREAGAVAGGAAREAVRPPRSRVTGRCVDGSGTPLDGCEITVYDAPNWAPAQRFANIATWRTKTGAGGTFDCEFDRDGRAAVTVGARCSGYLAILRPGVALAPGPVGQDGPVGDVGDLVLARGCKVHGIVVDTEDKPVPGYSLHLSGDHVDTAQSGLDGSFAFPQAVGPGKWRIQGLRDFRRVRTAPTLRVGPDQHELFHRVVIEAVDAERAIAGIVVDSDNAPVSGLWLACRNSAGAWIAQGSSGADGTFLLFSSAAEPGGLVTLVAPKHPLRELVGGAERQVAWGTRDLRLVTKRRPADRARVILTVRDGDTGEPIEAFRYRFYSRSAGYSESEPPHHLLGDRVYGDRPHPGGEATILGVLPGRHLLSVLPADPGLAPSGLETVEVPAGGEVLHPVTLFRRRDVRVRVRSGGGDPVAGTVVQLILYEGPGEFPDGGQAWPVEQIYDDETRGQGLVYSMGATDRNGEVTLTGRPAKRPYVLRLMGPGHIPAIHRGVQLGRDPVTVQVTVDRGGRLTGRFRPLSAWRTFWPQPDEVRGPGDVEAQRPQVILLDVDRRRFWPLGDSPALTVDREKGEFTAVGVPPGRYKVLVTCRRNGLRVTREPGDDIPVSGEEPRVVDLPLDPVAFGSLSGTVLLNGEPFDDERVYLYSAPDPSDRSVGARVPMVLKTDAAGRFAQRWVLPGEYTVATAQGAVGVETVRVAAGEDRRVTLAIRSVRLTIRVRTPQGAPAAGRRCEVRRKLESGETRPLKSGVGTDRNGELVLHPAPPGEFYLFFPQHGSATRATIGPLEAPADRYEGVLDVTLPAAAAGEPRRK